MKNKKICTGREDKKETSVQAESENICFKSLQVENIAWVHKDLGIRQFKYLNSKEFINIFRNNAKMLKRIQGREIIKI